MPDETKTPGQDNPSGKEAGTTSETEPETFTKEQADKQTSDALSKAGRDAKSLDKRGKDLDTRDEAIKAEHDRIAQWQRDRDAEELEAAKDNPEAMDYLKKKQELGVSKTQLTSDRATLDKNVADHKELLDAAEATKMEITIWDIAKEQKVDPGELKEACAELNLETKEQIESIAKRMAKAGGEPLKEPLKPDSSRTKGGGTEPKTADDKLKTGFGKLNK